MTDPPDLCCPLSKVLMLDPVVVADGITYERAWVEERLKQTPGQSPSTECEIETTVPWLQHIGDALQSARIHRS